MRAYLSMAAVVALLISPAALAQPANPKGNTPAVNTPNSPPNPTAPVSGANSFTEGQAKSRIESNGYTNVSGLRKDDQGVWRGMATKDGRSRNVSLDFQGNVVAQ
jgi:opacity protein-like surface antigen